MNDTIRKLEEIKNTLGECIYVATREEDVKAVANGIIDSVHWMNAHQLIETNKEFIGEALKEVSMSLAYDGENFIQDVLMNQIKISNGLSLIRLKSSEEERKASEDEFYRNAREKLIANS